jgi:predicted Zn-dependent peptidase
VSVDIHTLPNGFRVVTEHMPGLQSASIGVWVSAGCRHERADQNGIAHFLEHMAFKGTASRSALEIAETIEGVGGFINAYTSRETTAYFARVLADHVPLALEIIADILRNSVFDAREIEVERGVILQEIGQVNDTPDDVIFDWLQETAFPDQPMGRPILGPEERVRAFNRADLSSFVNDNYGPDQLILSAAGKVDHREIVAMAEALFGDMAARPGPIAQPAQFQTGELRRIRDLEQAHFALAYEAPGYAHDDVYTAQVFATAFGGGMSSRLFQEAREKRGLCYTIFAQAAAYAETGTLTIYAGTGGDEVGDLAQLSIDELSRAASDFSEAEVDRARAQMKAGMLMGLESPSSRAERIARLLAIWGRVPTLEETIEKIEAIDAVRLREFAGSLAASGQAASALYGPVQSAPSVAELVAKAAA